MEDTKNNATTTILSFMAGRSTRVVGDVEYLGDTKGDKMTLQAKSKLTAEQISELEARGRAWGEQEATLWRDVQSAMHEWTMWTYCGDLSAYEDDDETSDAAELVLDCAARAAWDAAIQTIADSVVDVMSVEYYDQLADDELRREYREHTDMTAATREQMDYIDRGCKAPCLS